MLQRVPTTKFNIFHILALSVSRIGSSPCLQEPNGTFKIEIHQIFYDVYEWGWV